MFISLFLYFASFFVYFQSRSIYGGDAGDLVSAAFTHGTAHPPGYPLYSLLGFLASKIPLYTVAWRVSLLSSIPAALSLTLIVLILRKTKVPIAYGFIAALTLGFSYLFWLYAIVPEVFSLHILLSLLFIYLMLEWYRLPTASLGHLYGAAFVFGLAATHHHIIVFLLPASAYLFFKKHAGRIRYTKKEYSFILIAVLVGLSPYLWAYISALGVPKLNWNDPVTITNFIKLVTRAQYGTFQSAITYGQTFQSRFLQFPVMWEFYSNDFTLIGLTLAFAGNIYLYKKERILWIFYLIAFIFTGPLFLFYASYLVISPFTLATYERFLLPSYVFIALWIGYGSYFTVNSIQLYLGNVSSQFKKNRTFASVLIMPLLILPLSLLYINYPKVSILKHDMTAEKLAYDILATPKGEKSIILMQYDTMIFNTEYEYFTHQSKYPNIVPIHLQKLLTHDIDKQLKKYYPTVILPEGEQLTLSRFIFDNYDSYHIYATADTKVSIPGSYWIPEGLLFRFYLKPDLPPYSQVIERNEALWKDYQDPLAGSLGSFKNLMLANVLDFYRDAQVRTAGLYINAGDYVNAKRHLKEAIRVSNDNTTAKLFLAEAMMKTNDCNAGKQTVDELPSIKNRLTKYFQVMQLYYTVCDPQTDKATYWRQKIESSAGKQEEKLPLKAL